MSIDVGTWTDHIRKKYVGSSVWICSHQCLPSQQLKSTTLKTVSFSADRRGMDWNASIKEWQGYRQWSYEHRTHQGLEHQLCKVSMSSRVAKKEKLIQESTMSSRWKGSKGVLHYTKRRQRGVEKLLPDSLTLSHLKAVRGVITKHPASFRTTTVNS